MTGQPWWDDDPWDEDPVDAARRLARERRRRWIALLVVIAMIAALAIPLLVRVIRSPEPAPPTSVVQVHPASSLGDPGPAAPPVT